MRMLTWGTQPDICSEKLAISHSPTTQLSNQRSVTVLSSFSLKNCTSPHDISLENNRWLECLFSAESSAERRLTISSWKMASLPVTVNVPSHTFLHHIQRISISQRLWPWRREQRGHFEGQGTCWTCQSAITALTHILYFWLISLQSWNDLCLFSFFFVLIPQVVYNNLSFMVFGGASSQEWA